MALSKLKKNPYTTRLIEILNDDKKIYMILSYNGSQNLQQYLDKNPLLSVKLYNVINLKKCEKRKIFFRICKAVRFCHLNGIIHKDIKMENIMIKSDQSIRLIDFGYSEILPRNQNKKVKFCGTPYYMPPEFIKNIVYNGSFVKFDIWFLIFRF